MEDEERGVRLRAGEAEGGDEDRKAVVPRTRGLLQTIESAVEAAHMVRVSGVDEASVLVAKDHLVETPMEEGVLDIELANLPVGGESDGEDNPNGSWFNHGAKDLVEVNAVLLGETAQHPTCFIAIEATVRFELVTEEPLARDDVGGGGRTHKIPRVVGE